MEEISNSSKAYIFLNNKQHESLLDDDLNKLEWLFNTIDRRLLPAVTIGGLVLQSLNVVVLLSKQLRNNAIRFLAAMSLVDVMFLLLQLPFIPVPYIANDSENASSTALAYYKFVQSYYERFVLYPMSRVCLETNTWLAVLVSCERYLVLRSANSWTCVSLDCLSSRKLALPAIFSAFLLSAVLNVNCFFEISKSADTNSTTNAAGQSEAGVEGPGAVVRFALTYLLPLVLLLTFNTALVYLLMQYCRKQLRMRSVKGLHLPNDTSSAKGVWRFGRSFRSRANSIADGHHVDNASESIRCHGHSRSTLSTALMVLAAMLVHLAFDAPGTALTVLLFFKGQAVVRANSWLVLASHASNVLVLVHCSIDWCARDPAHFYRVYNIKIPIKLLQIIPHYAIH